MQAEQLLARACENEAENAKRMRMGMEPVSEPMPVAPAAVPGVDVVSASANAAEVIAAARPGVSVSLGSGGTVFTTATTMAEKQLKTEYKSEQLATLLAATQQQEQPAQIQVAVSAPATVINTGGATTAFPATLNGLGVTVNGSVGNGTTVATVAGGTGTSIFRPTFPRNPSTYPGTPMLLQQGQALTQNGTD